jgi:ankyrin repeat protein
MILILFASRCLIIIQLFHSSMHCAVENNFAECTVIEALVALGFDVDALDRDGKTPLMVAVKQSNVNAIICLLEFNANWRLRANNDYCVSQSNNESFQVLLKQHELKSVSVCYC